MIQSSVIAGLERARAKGRMGGWARPQVNLLNMKIICRRRVPKKSKKCVVVSVVRDTFKD